MVRKCSVSCALRMRGWRGAPVSKKEASGASAICAFRTFIVHHARCA
ncbi:hypothetical protein A2U01_0084557, partial [Trifolium medium]|nr:hypothetical protein [Trifolium medium]